MDAVNVAIAQRTQLRHALIVSDFADVNGGQAKVAIDTARLLAGAGIEVSFFAASGPVSPLLDHPKINTTCLNQHTLASNPSRARAMLSGLWNRSAARSLATEIARHDPTNTVLLCHGWAKALSPSVGPVLAKSVVPVLYTMHEYFLACPNGGFFDYPAGQICTRKPLSISCITRNCDARHLPHKVWRVARSTLARHAGRLPSGLNDIAFISETQRKAMAPYLPKHTRLHHLPNPVSSNAAKIDASANSAFVFIGRLSPEKGVALCAEATLRSDVPVIFVGDGPEADRIREINPKATITGWVSPTAVQDYLTQARAVVFPSLWYECQPLVPIEALLRGVPVVCGRWSAAHEVVQHGVNGIIYDEPSVEALTQALTEVQKIGHFDTSALAEAAAPERHLDQLLAICETLLLQPGR